MRMRIALYVLIVLLFAGCKSTEQRLRDGDLVFQTSVSAQSVAVQIATGSRYSHVGMVYVKDDEFYVYEAAETVRLTPWKEWVEKGEDKMYAVKRLSDESLLAADAIAALKDATSEHFGKGYDLYFGWDDELIYCSELVYKVYHDGLGIEIGRLEKLSDLNLEHPVVKAKLKERYGDQIPYDMEVVSPGSIFDSNKLKLVYSNYK